MLNIKRHFMSLEYNSTSNRHFSCNKYVIKNKNVLILQITIKIFTFQWSFIL